MVWNLPTLSRLFIFLECRAIEALYIIYLARMRQLPLTSRDSPVKIPQTHLQKMSFH
jgi:hypothetical protein